VTSEESHVIPEPDSGDAALEREPVTPPQEAEVTVEAAAPAEDLDARLGALEAELARARDEGREAQARLAEERDRHLRAAAELDNARKRAQREREEIQKFGAERLLKDLLPVMDNLDRALSAAAEGDPLAQGVRLVRKVLEEALAKHGVSVFSALSKPFDPRLHEALAQLDAPGAEPGSVVAEHGRGYLLHDRLLRPALVAVAAARAKPAEAQPSSPDESERESERGSQSERGAGGPQAPQGD
jgi:molecular chaperone GrpE